MANLALSQSAWTTASKVHLLRENKSLEQLELLLLNGLFPQGLTRGCLVEIVGGRSSGRTSTCLYILTRAMRRNEICACVDLNNQFDPASLAQFGAPIELLSWVRCNGKMEHAIRSADLLLHAGGFGIVLLDLCGASARDLNKIPISYWFRFRRAVENTPTILLICSEHPQARSCTQNTLELRAQKFHWSGHAPFALLEGLELAALSRKARQSKLVSIRLNEKNVCVSAFSRL